jgi:DNA mismatch repair protein MutS
MSFIADKQTLEDMNLLGKYNQHSIFNLFNKVKTAGGEQLLQKMFQTPLTEPGAINKRSETFKYFQQKAVVFPFSNEQFGAMENYLSGDSDKYYPQVFVSHTTKKLLATILRDEEYPKIQSGLKQSIAVLYRCKTFISELEGDEKQVQHPFQDELYTIKGILNDAKLQWLAQEQTGSASYSLQKTARYDHLLKHTMRQALQTVMNTFYKLDVYLAVANLAREKGFNYAKALPKETNVFSATALRHPNINKAVANPVSFHKDSNLIFLTGANMAGKSTLMKAFSINIYLAHMGFPIAASNMEFSVKQGIYTSINVPDNLDMGLSHFYAEVLRVKQVAEEVSSGKDLVIVFDELFKGTNVKDAYDATLAVTTAFSEYNNCFFIISTHIIEAGEVLQAQHANIQMLYLPTVMNGNIPAYTYRLQTGISSDRHGMMIIKNEGILEMLK